MNYAFVTFNTDFGALETRAPNRFNNAAVSVTRRQIPRLQGREIYWSHSGDLGPVSILHGADAIIERLYTTFPDYAILVLALIGAMGEGGSIPSPACLQEFVVVVV